ncbi:hypothetical protein AVEN_248816-1 [Araneus ventricosus]|uniref:Uncharacterized protein n=1 Tax=Araneus ventricosus TaxID=182803 RepID=A0A4Y2J562_ARAVE|nr:hypothetical protein AVEN_248816-1 [Araneus ventricosus]
MEKQLLQIWKVSSQQGESYGWEESFTGEPRSGDPPREFHVTLHSVEKLKIPGGAQTREPFRSLVRSPSWSAVRR